jgi:hypothetical protein
MWENPSYIEKGIIPEKQGDISPKPEYMLLQSGKKIDISPSLASISPEYANKLKTGLSDMGRKINVLVTELQIKDMTTNDLMKPIIEKLTLILESKFIPKFVKEKYISQIGTCIDSLTEYNSQSVIELKKRQKAWAGESLPENISYFLGKCIDAHMESQLLYCCRIKFTFSFH